jgi:hypothetical protein
MALIMKNSFFWDIKTQFVLHKKHITSPLQSPAGYYYVRFEVFTGVTMKNAVFLDANTQFVFTGETFPHGYSDQPVNAM